MGKQVDQGTRWESAIVTRARAIGRTATRTPKTGKKNEPDLIIDGEHRLPVVFWENWIKRNHRRRAVRMVVMNEADFWKLLDLDKDETYGILGQAKSTQALSVRAVLAGLVTWQKENDG